MPMLSRCQRSVRNLETYLSPVPWSFMPLKPVYGALWLFCPPFYIVIANLYSKEKQNKFASDLITQNDN